MLSNRKRKWRGGSVRSFGQEFKEEEKNEGVFVRSESAKKQAMLEEAGPSTGTTQTRSSARRCQDLSDDDDYDEEGGTY